MTVTTDWLSRLLDIMSVSGHLDIRCFYGAPWRIAFARAEAGEMPYHAVLGGAAELKVDDLPGAAPRQLRAGDIVMLPHGSAHILDDGSGDEPMPARNRAGINLIISENAGTGDRLDMMCGRFVLSPAHHRLLQDYLPAVLVVSAADHSASTARPGTTPAQLAGLVGLMRSESAGEDLGGRAMLNALSTAMFTLILRLASELDGAPRGLLALAGHPRLAPALAALFNEPDRPWSLPELARLSNMSRATLVRHFREKLGHSPSDLLRDIRITLAASKLRKSASSSAAIAAEVGYQSEAAFQRAFKQRMGLTPAQWRRAG
jgi:AraC family transcriptional regulator, activator of mtrCDE